MINRNSAVERRYVFMALFARMDPVAMAAAVALLFALASLAQPLYYFWWAPRQAFRSVLTVGVGQHPSRLQCELGRKRHRCGLGGRYRCGDRDSSSQHSGTSLIIVFMGLSRAYPIRAKSLFAGAATRPETVVAKIGFHRWTIAVGRGPAQRLDIRVGVGLGLGLLLYSGNKFICSVVATARSLSRICSGYSCRAIQRASGGAWTGLLWGAIYGAISGGALAWLYARSLGARLTDQVMWDADSARQLRPPLLQISSHALGISLGAIAALQLVFATLWLVLRGTADESVHAKLLSYYLPGYTVTLQGSLLGGLELFLLVYLSSVLVGKTYNAVTRYRHKGEVK